METEDEPRELADPYSEMEVRQVYRVHCHINFDDETYCGWIETIQIVPTKMRAFDMTFWLMLPDGRQIPGTSGDFMSCEDAAKYLERKMRRCRRLSRHDPTPEQLESGVYPEYREVAPEDFQPYEHRNITCRAIGECVKIDWGTDSEIISIEEAVDVQEGLYFEVGWISELDARDSHEPLPPEVYMNYLPSLVVAWSGTFQPPGMLSVLLTGEEALKMWWAIGGPMETASRARYAARNADWRQEGF